MPHQMALALIPLTDELNHSSFPVANGSGGGQCGIDTGDVLASVGIPSWDF